MEDFYRNWLKKENERRNRKSAQDTSVVGGANIDPQPSTSASASGQVLNQPSEIVYENDFLRLKVEKKKFQRQKIFKLQDHLFNFKIEAKRLHESLPLLSDIFDFLHAALTHVLESIKTFYNPDDHNVAYLTLHQEPMVNGLNTGDEQ